MHGITTQAQRHIAHLPRKKLALLASFVILFSLTLSLHLFAAPPGSPYAAGETLDPACSPGDANCSVEAAGALEIGGEVDSATQGSIFFVGASGVLAQDNANLFWDDASNELGIGTAAPSAFLHVLGTTEQLRLGYDASNYWSATIGSTGGLTLAGTGTGGSLNLTPASGQNLTVTLGGTAIAGYAADYSANYTDRSFADKGYVDDVAEGIDLGSVLAAGSVADLTPLSQSFTITNHADVFSSDSPAFRLQTQGGGINLSPYYASITSNSAARLVIDVDEHASDDIYTVKLVGPNGEGFVLNSTEGYRMVYNSTPGGFVIRNNSGEDGIEITTNASTATAGIFLTNNGGDGGITITNNDIASGITLETIGSEGISLSSSSGSISVLTPNDISSRAAGEIISESATGISWRIYSGVYPGVTEAELVLDENGLAFSDLINYDSDLSGSYTSRSLVDKGYVDAGDASDPRLKDITGDLESTLSFVMATNPVRFTWHENVHSTLQGADLGFTTDQFEDAFPELIRSDFMVDEETYNRLLYERLTPILWKATQEVALTIQGIQELADNTFLDRLIAWMGDAGNGILKIFAKEVETERLCLDGLCITRAELQQLLDGQSLSGGSSGDEEDESEGDDIGDGEETAEDDGIDDGADPVDDENPEGELPEDPVDDQDEVPEADEPEGPEPAAGEPADDGEESAQPADPVE